MGRKKIKMELVKDPNTRQVTFSKRRTGLFKKTNELSIMCGTEIAVVVFSPGNKPYSYGHPSVDAVAAKYLQIEPNSDDDAQGGSTSNPSADVFDMDQQNLELADVMAQIREEEKKAKVLAKTLKEQQVTIRSEYQDLNDCYGELQGMVEKRLTEFEIAELMVLLSEGKVEGMTVENKDEKKK